MEWLNNYENNLSCLQYISHSFNQKIKNCKSDYFKNITHRSDRDFVILQLFAITIISDFFFLEWYQFISHFHEIKLKF